MKAISAIAVGTTFDVKAQAANDPKNAKGVDATKFIKALRAMDEGNPAEGCPAAPAKDSDGDGIKDTFIAVKAGTPVCFEVIADMNKNVSGIATGAAGARTSGGRRQGSIHTRMAAS